MTKIKLNVKNINNKLVYIARLMRALTDEELEAVLINRAMLDRVFLMRKGSKTDREIIESLSFRELSHLDSLFLSH